MVDYLEFLHLFRPESIYQIYLQPTSSQRSMKKCNGHSEKAMRSIGSSWPRSVKRDWATCVLLEVMCWDQKAVMMWKYVEVCIAQIGTNNTDMFLFFLKPSGVWRTWTKEHKCHENVWRLFHWKDQLLSGLTLHEARQKLAREHELSKPRRRKEQERRQAQEERERERIQKEEERSRALHHGTYRWYT